MATSGRPSPGFSDAIIEVWADTIRDDLDSLTRIANELYLPDLQAADHTALRHRGQLNMWADASSAAERADLAVRGVDPPSSPPWP